jgi:hypothetical protein
LTAERTKLMRRRAKAPSRWGASSERLTRGTTQARSTQAPRERFRCSACGAIWIKPDKKGNCPKCHLPTVSWRKYVPMVRDLFKKHGLRRRQPTELIAKTIAKLPQRRNRQKVEEATPREHLKKARGHTVKLLEYARRRFKLAHEAGPGCKARTAPMRRLTKRLQSLQSALDHSDVVFWLTLARPTVDVQELLLRLKAADYAVSLSASNLSRLLKALDYTLSGSGRTGRPMADQTRVIRAACFAWLYAGRHQRFTWDESSGKLTGPLAIFAQDLLSRCNMPMSDAALHRALQIHIRECKAALKRRAQR